MTGKGFLMIWIIGQIADFKGVVLQVIESGAVGEYDAFVALFDDGG